MRDRAETGFFACVDTLQACLDVMPPMLSSMTVRVDKIRGAVDAGFALATDLADYLVAKALPFREAHHAVGALVGYCVQQGKTFDKLGLDEYRRFSPLFDHDVLDITIQKSMAARDVPGGTAPRQVALALAAGRAHLDGTQALTVPDLNPATFAAHLM